MKSTTDTPRTDACPHCGAEEFELPVEGYRCGTEPWYDEDIGSCLVRSNICYSNENTQLLSKLAAAKAEVERLRSQLARSVEIAETACKYLDTGGWNEDETYSGKDGWVTETEINEVCATLAALKSEIK
jgi:hypothetical protein